MKNRLRLLCFSASLSLFSGVALADDIEGKIESIDKGERSFVVQGITFYVDDSTDYDDGLKGFDDLQVGQRVEVDFDYRDGRHLAREIELDDR